MADTSTVRSVTCDLLRSLGMTTVFGNPGSTEETFLQDFPADFSYVLALQEASAIAMADSFAQVTAMPKPWVKWSYEPARAQDVPEAFMRAYAVALRPPAGPVYLSIPL
jgi:benzoylformate decarboxylase